MKPLLPAGCYDLLPPYARYESRLSHILLTVFESYGYEQVAPPLLEYSDNLLSGRGSALSSQIFRVMDVGSHRVMGIRADITMQVARIASTRLSHAPRPLRLCYNGLIMRMNGEQLKNNRQLRQTGIELIGVSAADADAEVIIVAAEALKKVGINKISIDLNLPGIVGSLLASERLDEGQAQSLLSAIAHKDVSSIKLMNFSYRDSLIGLLQSAGAADSALSAIDRLDLPDAAHRQVADLKQVVEILRQRCNADWEITIDATESRGVGYHSGISFSIFVSGASCEVGRGGRYRVQGETALADSEATGFTLYVENILEILPQPERGKRILVSDGISCKEADFLHEQGFIVLFALGEYGRGIDEAKRLDCKWIYKDGRILEVNG